MKTRGMERKKRILRVISFFIIADSGEKSNSFLPAVPPRRERTYRSCRKDTRLAEKISKRSFF